MNASLPAWGFWRAVVALLLVSLGGCAYRAIDSGPGEFPVESLARDLDRRLLAEGYADELIVEVDWVAGCEPGLKTIAGLERILDKYLAPGLKYEIYLDDEIPLELWQPETNPLSEIEKLVRQFASDDVKRAARLEHRYVLFVPSAGGRNGFATNWILGRESTEPITVEGLVVARAIHERQAKLWLSRDKFERMTLIHEFGHVLGLVTNDRHERVDAGHEHHCNRLKCVMAHPTMRVILRNAPPGLFNVFMKDYCKACQEDIRRAQEYWSKRRLKH